MRHGRLTENIAHAELNGEIYYHGAPCRRGHCGRRYISTNACVPCAASHSLKLTLKRRKLKYEHKRTIEGTYRTVQPDAS